MKELDAIDAIDGAQDTFNKEAEAENKRLRDEEATRISKERLEKLEVVINALGEIDGIDFQFSTSNTQETRFFARLLIGKEEEVSPEPKDDVYVPASKRPEKLRYSRPEPNPVGYELSIDSYIGGYRIERENKDYSSNGIREDFECYHADLSQVANSIAYILGSHYPEKANAVDEVVRSMLTPEDTSADIGGNTQKKSPWVKRLFRM